MVVKEKMSDAERLAERIPIISTLPAAEKSSLISKLRPVNIRSGQFIVKEGAEHSELIFIASGQLKASHCDKRGKEVILALLVEGEFFGEIALLTGSNRSADVVALVPSTVLMLSQKDFMEHIDKFTGLSKSMMAAMAKRIRVASQRITDLALFDVSCRVARALWSIGELSEKAGKNFSIVRAQPTHQTIAGIVGSSREVVSRALKALESDGHIAYEEDTLLVLSLP